MMKQACEVCKSKHAKYKCPTCRLPFCSVACSKTHKSTPCKPPEKQPQPSSGVVNKAQARAAQSREESEKELDDCILLTPAQLALLDTNDEVQRKLRDDRVMDIIKRIDSAPNRTAALQLEMKNPAFLEFCDDIMEAVGCDMSPNKEFTLREYLTDKQ